MPKIKNCPDCGEELHSDCWAGGRKLQQKCSECDWKGEPRIPDTQKIKSTKKICAGMFYGYHYEIFDKYGHISTSSRYYDSKKEAHKEMMEDLTKENTWPDYSPCTAILWPSEVTVKGESFKC